MIQVSILILPSSLSNYWEGIFAKLLLQKIHSSFSFLKILTLLLFFFFLCSFFPSSLMICSGFIQIPHPPLGKWDQIKKISFFEVDFDFDQFFQNFHYFLLYFSYIPKKNKHFSSFILSSNSFLKSSTKSGNIQEINSRQKSVVTLVSYEYESKVRSIYFLVILVFVCVLGLL